MTFISRSPLDGQAPLAGEGVAQPLSLAETTFSGLLALMVLGFFVMPGQTARNFILYLAALAAHPLLREATRLYRRPEAWVVPLLVGLPLASLAWSSATEAALAKRLVIAAYCLLAIQVGMARLLGSDRSLADRLIELMLVAGSLVGLAALGVWLTAEAPAARLEGLWGLDNPVHATILLLFATIPVLWQVLAGLRSPAWLAALVVPVAFAVLAGGRMALAAYAMVVLSMVVLTRRRAIGWVLAAAVAGATGALLLLGPSTFGEIWLERGFSYRPEIWQQVWTAYRGCDVLIGCGIGTPLTIFVGEVEGHRAHSIYLAALYHQGLLGLIALVVGLGWLLYRGFSAPVGDLANGRGWAWALAFVLLASATSGDHLVVRATLFWSYFWIPVLVLSVTGSGKRPPVRA